MIVTKIISSLEKVFLDDDPKKFPELKKISALRGERLSLQLLYRYENAENEIPKLKFGFKAEGELAKHAIFYDVINLPVAKPVFHFKHDENYLRTSPGLFPDLLEPKACDPFIYTTYGLTEAVWLELNVPNNEELSGEYPLTIIIFDENGEKVSENSILIDVIPTALPEQKLIFTQWFYCDCLAEYYNVSVFSKRHWEIIENYAKAAVRLGINTLLTPVFTPPLDTAVNGERLTTQLVKIKKNGKKYSFSFSLLDKWIAMCDRVGIKNLEISHLFTQWGATHAPKIIATVDGEEKQIFGWETDAHGEEYTVFIRSFLKALISHDLNSLLSSQVLELDGIG